MTKANLAREIIEKFPHTSKKELGKILYKLNPLVFKDEEDARKIVRAVTGSMAGSEIKVTHKEIYKGLPEGIKNDFSPYVLNPGKWGALMDTHFPFHDKAAIETAINDLLKQGCKKLILNGDIVDCYQISRFDKDPDGPRLRDEIRMLREWLKFLLTMFEEVKYKIANHEERLGKFLLQKAPELYQMEILNWRFLLDWDPEEKKHDPISVELIENKRIIHAGKLNIVHAHEFEHGISAPVNPARGFFLKAKANVLGGHHHQVSEHIEPDINGKIYGAWSVGCLCDLHPQYKPINKWAHGFAIIELAEDGEFTVYNKRIIDGRVR